MTLILKRERDIEQLFESIFKFTIKTASYFCERKYG